MRLTSGTRLGEYEVTGTLGAGGMGEVYRARDVHLNREVALKILPALFSSDPERTARFKREAQVLASLNNPHIASIYGFVNTDLSTGTENCRVDALVLELVDGPTLADRLSSGPLPMELALRIARQLTEALEAAHEQGIVHRDLKPANIKVRDDGTVKVLDFGLAKALDADVSGGSGEILAATTTTAGSLTQAGVILGTTAYMSPEQARGYRVDRRSDIWSFACVLYEMIAGRQPFAGGDLSETLVFVLTREPDWSALPPDTPASIRRLLQRALQKDRKRRLSDIADARLELDEAAGSPGTVEHLENRPPKSRRMLVAAAVGIALLSIAAATLGRWGAADPPEMRVDIFTPPTSEPGSFAISPDGQAIAYVALGPSQRHVLWVRSFEADAARALPGTEGASLPFWAPNSQSIGFFSEDGLLKRIDLDGGAVRALARAPLQWGGAWSRTGTILFSPRTGPLMRVPDTGGEPVQVTNIQPHQSNHSSPRFLTDGNQFLYFVSGSSDVRGVYAAALDRPEGRRLIDADGSVTAVTGDHVLFVRGTTAFAQELDPVRVALRGTATPVARSLQMATSAASQLAALSASTNGRIAYRTGTLTQLRQFAWFDRSGRELEKLGEPDPASPLSPSLSADGRRLVFHRGVDGNVDLWTLETQRGIISRLTSNPANEIHALWSPDGSKVLFSSNRNGAYELYEKSAVGTATEERLVLALQSPATDWSPDGRFVLTQRRAAQGSTDIWVLSTGTDQAAVPLEQTEFDERDGQFSPDGKWVAYASNESARWEVYIAAFPGPGPKARISIAGGAQARWRKDGKELFYIALDNRLMAVPITVKGSSLDPGNPVPLFATRIGGAVQGSSRQQYFVSPDGQRFLMNTVLDGNAPSAITVILNWKPQAARAVK